MAASVRRGLSEFLRPPWSQRRRKHEHPVTTPGDEPETRPADPARPLPDGNSRTLAIAFSVMIIGGVLLSQLQPPDDEATFPFRWPPAALDLSDAIAWLGVLTAVVLGAILESRGVAERITALRRSKGGDLRAEEPQLVRRYWTAAGVSGAAAVAAAVVGTTSLLAYLPGDPFAVVVICALAGIVVVLSTLVKTTSRKARIALERELDRRQEREIRVLRTLESLWSAARRPPRRHGSTRVVVAVAMPSTVLGLLGGWSVATEQMPHVGLILVASAVVLVVLTSATVYVVRASALQRASEDVGLWLPLVPFWILLHTLAVLRVGVVSGSLWWLVAAAVLLLVVNVAAGVWVARGLLDERGVFRHLRPHVARSISARADALERHDDDEAPTREPRCRLIRQWKSMTGPDARADEAAGG